MNMINFSNLNLKKKLFISLAMFVFMPLLVLSIVFLLLSFKTELSNTTETQLKENKKNAEHLEQIFEYSDNIYSNLLYEYYMDYFLEQKATRTQYYHMAQYLDDLLVRYPYYKNFVIYNENGIVYQRGTLLKNISDNLLFKENVEGVPSWNMPHELEVSDIYNNQKVEAISYSHILFEYKKDEAEAEGVFEINYDPNELYKEVFETSEIKQGHNYLIDADGIIYLGDMEDDGDQIIPEYNKLKKYMNQENGDFFVWYDNQPQVLFYQKVGNNSFYIVKFIPLINLLANRGSALIIILFMALICILFAFLFSRIQKKYIIKPLFEISNELKKIEKGNFSISLPELSKDEIGNLGAGVVKMSNKLDELIKENYVRKIKQQDAEMNALVTQINPHFLYNTLDSLRWMAIKKDEQEISAQIEALSTIFRNILNKGKNTIKISEEIKFLESYVFIMNKRYNDKIQFLIEVEENELIKIQNHSILKLMIQPLIENCFVHGLKDKAENGIIIVRFYIVDNNLFVEVEDNGKGIELEGNIQEIMRNESAAKYSALKNIYDRIQLFYGDGYGMYIQGKKEKGTCITLKLPYA